MKFWIFFIFYLGQYFFICFGIYVQEFFEFFKNDDFWLCKNAIENWVYLIVTQILKFWFFWVVIHPELRIEILRPMEKEFAQLDLPFLSYGQKTSIVLWWKRLSFGYFFNIVSPIQLNPCPWVLEFLY